MDVYGCVDTFKNLDDSFENSPPCFDQTTMCESRFSFWEISVSAEIEWS